MADRCVSTLICAKPDQPIFERMGYRLDSALMIEGEELSGSIVMIDERSAGEHYDELTKLKHAPFVASNAARRGVFGGHLLVSDGRQWAYAEALCESWYPAVRVNRDGDIAPSDFADACAYWRVHNSALEQIKQRAQDAAAGKESRP